MKEELILIEQGAESKIYLINNNLKKFILKYRFKKNYRIKELDKEIRKKRTIKEKRIINKLIINNIKVPQLFNINDILNNNINNIFNNNNNDILNLSKEELNENCILMEFIEGGFPDINNEFLELTGKIIYNIHNIGIIHGDLTPSNFIQINSPLNFVLLDFGLSFNSNKIEDKAVDLYGFERSILSINYNIDINKLYLFYNNNDVINKLNDIRKRGRKK